MAATDVAELTSVRPAHDMSGFNSSGSPMVLSRRLFGFVAAVVRVAEGNRDLVLANIDSRQVRRLP